MLSQEESLAGQRAQVPNRQHRILEVVQQLKAQYQIEDSEPGDVGILNVSLTKRYSGKAVSRLDHILQAPIESANVQAAFVQRLREEAHTIPHPAHSRGSAWASAHLLRPEWCCPAPKSIANRASCRKR